MNRSRVCLLLLCSLFLVSISWAQTTPLTLIPTGPCRVLDTRGAPGPFGGPSLAANTVRPVNIPANPACSVPNTAAGYALNVTVVPHGRLGYITIWPDGETQPLVSTLNSYDGRIKAVSAIVGAGNANSIDVFTTDRTDLVLDITGYFVGPGNRNALYYYPLSNMCELVNTINPPTPDGLGGPALLDGIPRTFAVRNNPNCHIPSQVAAYALNVIAMPVGGAPLGYITVWPADQAQPLASLLNSPTGTDVANASIVSAGTGDISVFAFGNDTNVEIDLVGYFGPAEMNRQNGDALYTFTPCRGFDSRPYTFTNRLDYIFQTQGGCQATLPAFTVTPPIDAYVVNATLVPDGPIGYLPIWAYGQPMPTPTTLMAMDGAVTSNMAIVTTGRRQEISTFAGSPTNLIFDVSGYFASPRLTMLTTMPMPPGQDHVAYGPVVMSARGGVPPYTWSANMPSDLSIDPDTAAVTGCPILSEGGGDPEMTIQVKDSAHNRVTETANFTINPLPTLAIATATLPAGTLNVPYSFAITATGGYGAYTWSQVSGNLPPGFTFSSNGVISGYDAGTRGTWTFTVQVTDQQCEAPAPPAQTFHLRIN